MAPTGCAAVDNAQIRICIIESICLSIHLFLHKTDRHIVRSYMKNRGSVIGFRVFSCG